MSFSDPEEYKAPHDDMAMEGAAEEIMDWMVEHKVGVKSKEDIKKVADVVMRKEKEEREKEEKEKEEKEKEEKKQAALKSTLPMRPRSKQAK